MANNKTLLEINGKEIEKYLIINDSDRLNDDDIKDGGNIIILDTGERTDIYIGDEHIAGGYGFNEEETPNEILERIKVLEEKTWEDGYKSNQTETETHNPVTIDNKDNKIFIDDCIYELKLKDIEDSQELYIDKYVRPSIFDIEFWYIKSGQEVKYEAGEMICDSVGVNSCIPSRIIFNYNGSYDLTENDIKIITNDNSLRILEIEKTSISINDRILDDTISDKIRQKRIIITFSNKDKENFISKIGNQECVVNLSIKVELENNTINLTKQFSTWSFTYPCIYGTEMSSFYDELSDNHNVFSLTFNNSCEVMFNHGNTETYGFVYVPKNVLGKYIEVKDIICLSNSSNIRFSWKMVNSRTFSKVHYWALQTPQQYKGDVTWTFSLNK